MAGIGAEAEAEAGYGALWLGLFAGILDLLDKFVRFGECIIKACKVRTPTTELSPRSVLLSITDSVPQQFSIAADTPAFALLLQSCSFAVLHI